MIKETFRNIEYSNDKRFKKDKQGKIVLRKWSDDLVFAVNFDTNFDSIYSIGSKEPLSITGNAVTQDFDVFGFSKHGVLSGEVIYEEESFGALLNEGSIKLWLKPDFNNATGEQTFKSIDPVIPIIQTDVYGITLENEGVFTDISFTLNTNADNTDIYNALSLSIQNEGFSCFRDNSNRIKIKTNEYGNRMQIHPHIDESVLSLIDLLGGVFEPVIPNAPTENVEFLSLKQNGDNRNAIILTHNTESHIDLKMYDYEGNLIVDEDLGLWSNCINEYSSFEFNFNQQIGQFFINGKLTKVFITDVDRQDVRTNLHLKGLNDNFHHIDELQIYDKTQHNKNYPLETAPLTPYDNQRPYVDISYGQGFKENEIQDIIVDGSEGLNFTVKMGLTWYFYYNGAWRTGDGSFNQTSDIDLFEAKFSELFFNEEVELLIRVYFNSDGWTEVELDEISIIIDKGSEASAVITSDIRLLSPIDLSTNCLIKIATDKETREIDISSAALDVNNVTLEEIKQSIRDAQVIGLDSVSDDGEGRLVLISTTKGKESLISISDGDTASALDLVWGNDTIDLGEDDESTIGTYQDYSEIFRWVRAKLGAPLVPVEITDEQVEDNISEAVYHWNKWRNFQENIVYANLAGNARNGWEIPAGIGGDKNITEIIMEPRYPSGYYGGRDDLMGNIFIQKMFGGGKGAAGFMKSAADYSIALNAQQDLNNILGTNVTWEVLNKRLFIYPTPSNSLRIGIKYKSSLTLDEIVTSQPIKDMTLALSKIVLGNIRSTFGNQIPGGDGMLQLNGSELKSEGQQDVDKLKDSWKRSTEPLGFEFG